MDLRSIINTEGGDGSASKVAAPVTPVQAVSQQSFRDYSIPPHASPSKHPPADYGSRSGGPYASPTPYQSQGNYQGRPGQPPPLQTPTHNDIRSPAASYTAQSPYRQTPTSSVGGGQYPFPQTHQSPVQAHQYPPPQQQQAQHRDSYQQTAHLQHQNSHGQGSVTPQTPPVGIPGAPHPYLQHQRSQSSISVSTPTSAHSQQQYFGNQQQQDSPISVHQFPVQPLPQHQRQSSQQSHPGTPLGPPIQAQRQSSGGFVQPTSPYQQRGMSAGTVSQYQTSPAPPPPAAIPRLPSTPSAYESHRTSTSENFRRSQSERERSLSVSPKTRLPSQTPSNSRESFSILHEQPEVGPSASAKRKMSDRESPVEQRQSIEQISKPQVNGNHQSTPVPASSPQRPQQPPAKKKMRYTEPPIWARSVRGGFKSSGIKVNGRQGVSGESTPPPAQTEANGHRHVSPAVGRSGPPSTPGGCGLLGAWEESISGIKPVEELSRIVADWLYGKVVSRSDIGELQVRGVEVEIEAKLGQLINKDTNERYRLPVESECLLSESGRVGFKSSMTETQHKALNEFLNQQVTETHPENPRQATKKRVPIGYRHRRERDRFFELPASAQAMLPPAIRAELNPRHTVKVRVTHDQKTNQLLAKIVKARVADLDMYCPQSVLDCRISVNLEMRYDGDIEGLIGGEGTRLPDRNKDRLSYTQSHYQIDLTQVTQVTSINGVSKVDKEHELEIELSAAALREQGRRATAGEPNEYIKLVEGLMDNVRVLSRRASQVE
ncbi:hypothetical protein BP6252_01757 [Coleophoma cylindrospora]|uniref:mRNA-capping enzyme subunit beta n=1 Tax=Coleophoma cylindrospora TaxID=1849047 RepID=A0A3D8STW3_9HELO|nr:hypothetical protein BP6252_01757 [Coleophoma cylindrospora]